MDFHLKQWRNQHESEEQHSTKMPKLLLPESHQQPQTQSSASALPLFVPEPNSKVSTLSDSTLATTNRFPRMGSYFSLSQWQELELQALIFRYMLAGAAVPPELLQPIKKSLLHSPHYFLHHPLQHYQPALLQSGYWGRGAMDPEPGRCRRTDGKKWRCSRDVVAGQKYCERHMHRGKNRSRKPVELPTPTSTCGGGGSLGLSASSSISSPLATASLKSPFDLLHLNERSSGTKNEDKSLFENEDHVGGDGRSGGHMLRHFFDDWPRSLQDSDNVENNAGRMNSATCLSISMPGNTSSDVSLKLSTGYGEEPGPRNENVDHEAEAEQLQLNWAGGWASANQVASMGGPLAEALRSSTSNSSPTSVLHHLPRGSGSETSFIST
ncbi:Growth-regulating factor 4 [Spatholobus suberectus]|nr:Growth-regulating factor 4 [Spatholobus suberectus]